MLAFLVIVLVAGFVLISLIEGVGKRGRSGRGSRAGGGRSSAHASTPTKSLNRADMTQRWAVIEATSQGGAAGLKSAITEADKLLDQALRQSGLSGDTMGERLKSARPRFADRGLYDALWRAHKLRNALAHEVGFDLVPSQAKEALRDFERGLKYLGAL